MYDFRWSTCDHPSWVSNNGRIMVHMEYTTFHNYLCIWNPKFNFSMIRNAKSFEMIPIHHPYLLNFMASPIMNVVYKIAYNTHLHFAMQISQILYEFTPLHSIILRNIKNVNQNFDWQLGTRRRNYVLEFEKAKK